MEEKVQMKKGKFLRIVSPKLYNYLTTRFEEDFNIHPYDMQLEGIENEKGVFLLLKFGDNYAHVIEEFFSFPTIDEAGEELENFVKESGEACKEIMIADYFKMMEP